MSFFELQSADGTARAGVLATDHGNILTPVFMPVGTQGAVKAVEHRELHEAEVQIILGNTYHLYLRPGEETLSYFGGHHRFISWNKPILTDSGGFQIFSLKDLRIISEKGVEFRSHIDGSKHFFSPESVIETQRIIGSDIMMPLDECAPFPSDYKYAKDSMEMTVRWAARNKSAFDGSMSRYGHKQFLFGIGQGSVYSDLRSRCIEQLVGMDFSGYAIGGLAVGEQTEIMYDIAQKSAELLPADKPRYLMGVGTPENLLTSIEMGIDMFDCVMPTRNARNGTIFTTRGKINIRNLRNRLNEEPIDPGLDNYASQSFSLGYLRHLFIAGELTGLQLASLQNTAFYQWLMRTAREKILSCEFRQWSHNFLDNFHRMTKERSGKMQVIKN